MLELMEKINKADRIILMIEAQGMAEECREELNEVRFQKYEAERDLMRSQKGLVKEYS